MIRRLGTRCLTSDQLPLLVTGITGVAGFNAFRYLRQRYPGRVCGIRPRQTWALVGDGIVAANAEDRRAIQELFRHHRFRTVLNCTGNCALKSCELDPEMATLLNVVSVEILLDEATRHGSRLVHLSCDLVFSGRGAGRYREEDAVDPVTVYGQTMVEGERLVRSLRSDAAILRISLPMGPSFNRHAGAIDWIDSRFRHGRPATLYFDEVRSCTYTEDLNPVLEWFLANEAAGLHHLGGPRPNTLHQIGQIVNRVGGYHSRLLKGYPRIDAGPIPPRAGNVTMCSDKLVGLLGLNPFRPWPAEECLWPTDRLWHFDRQPSEHGSFQDITRRLYHDPREEVVAVSA